MPLPTFVAGSRPTAAQWKAWVADQVVTSCTSSTRPSSPVNPQIIYETDTKRLMIWEGSSWIVWRAPWASYNPTWTATVTNPALGNGTLTGRMRTVDGSLDIDITLTLGSTSTMGSGVWRLSIPQASVAGRNQLGSWWTFSGPKNGVAIAGGNAFVECSGDALYIGPTTPHTWASGNQLNISLRGIEV